MRKIVIKKMEECKMELIVFTNNGQTYHFKGVENFRPTTTGVKRSAVFNNTSTAGYALREV